MKILVATGGSKHSDEAVYTGAELSRITRSALTILTAIKDPERSQEAQSIVERAVSLAREIEGRGKAPLNGMQIDVKVRIGHPAEEIVHEAEEGNYSLIVVGTWPSRDLFHRLLAPTTERILMQAGCPVLISKGVLNSLDQVLLCVSGADSSSKAAHFLSTVVRQMSADMNITILHVMSQISANPDGDQGWQLTAPAERLIQEGTSEGQWLSREIDILSCTRANLKPKVRHGLVVDEVLMELFTSSYDLLVIGANRQAGWQRFLLDDLTNQIVVRADRPVLIV